MFLPRRFSLNLQIEIEFIICDDAMKAFLASVYFLYSNLDRHDFNASWRG